MIALLHGVVRGEWAEPENALREDGLRAITAEGLSLIYSGSADTPQLPMPQSALEFHRLQQQILGVRDLVPFRFPTLLATEELAPHLALFASRYHAALERVAGCVQIEVEIEMPPEVTDAPASGTAYLRAKAERARDLRCVLDTVKGLAAGRVREWRMRERQKGRRLYALAPRSSVGDLQLMLAQCAAPGASLRVTGPWPATEFMELKDLTAERTSHEE